MLYTRKSTSRSDLKINEKNQASTFFWNSEEAFSKEPVFHHKVALAQVAWEPAKWIETPLIVKAVPG